MSKTVDDLVKVYIIAHFGADNGPRNRERYRAGIAAVVRALRDELNCAPYCPDCQVTMGVFAEILGDAGAGKVAGGSTREDECGLQGQVTPSPATTPAPAVCEWRANEYEGAYSPGCETPAVWYSDGSETPQKEGYNFCPSCGKPIKFTEAKP